MVIQIYYDDAIVKTDDEQLQAQLHAALQTTRVSYEVTARGLKKTETMIDFTISSAGLKVALPLVPRLVRTTVEAGTPVTLLRGRRRLDVPATAIRRRGAALAAWNRQLLRFCAAGLRGQYVSASRQHSARLLNSWIDQHAEANWMLIVPNGTLVHRWGQAIAARHPGRDRTGANIWQSRPFQAIVAAKDAPLEAAWINFQQVFVVEARCLLTASLREMHDVVRSPIVLLRRRYDHFSAAEELLLERLAGPVVAADDSDPATRTSVIRIRGQADTTRDSLAVFLQRIKLDQFDDALPSVLTIVVGTEALAAEYRTHAQQHPLIPVAKYRCEVISLDDVVLHGLPPGIVLFWQDTADWLGMRGRFPLRGTELRIVIDPHATTNARYENHHLTICD